MKKNKDNISTENKRYITITMFFIIAFIFLAMYLVYFQSFESESIAKSEYNGRLLLDNREYQRGNIYERNGEVLSYTEKNDEGNYIRKFPFGEVDAPITGYSSYIYGRTGIEKNYNRELIGFDPEKERTDIDKKLKKQEVGNDIFLTLDQRIQDISWNVMNGKTGSIVVMNPYSGEILGMVSTPTFDPNNLEENWDNLMNAQNGEMLNRATQGIYRPGSTMKIVSALAVLEKNPNEFYKDKGEEWIGQFKVTNYNHYVWGELDLKNAFTNSVNTYFANKVFEMGYDNYKEITDRFMFNQSYKFDLDKSDTQIPWKELYDADLAMTAFGYGKTQINPLHMTMISSSIANSGKMMQPYLVSSVKDKNGYVVKETEETVLSEVMNANQAKYIGNLMRGVVDNGYNEKMNVKGLNIAGKTGTVENAKGTNDVWFTGFYPLNNPKYAFSIIVEDVNGIAGDNVGPLVRELTTSLEDLE